MQSANCLLTGDGTVGKSCLLICYTKNGFLDYNACFNNCAVHVTVEGREVDLYLWDTIDMEEYTRLRVFCYEQANVLIICFSIGSSVSYENVKLKWYPEACQYCPNVPILLVGTKKDLRHSPEGTTKAENPTPPPITTEQGAKLAREIGAVKYMECSAINQEGIKEVFEEAARAALKPIAKKDKPNCCLL